MPTMKLGRLLLSVVSLSLSCSKEEKAPPPAAAALPPPAAGVQRVALSVTINGFEPTPVKVKEGQPLELVVTRQTDKTCATDIVVPGYDIKMALPLGEPVIVAFTPRKSGELKYGCAMDQMLSGVLLVE